MAVARSRFFKSAVLASGNILTSCLGIATAMVLVRIFSKSDYGTYKQAILVFMFASPILIMGLPECLYYFIPREKSRSRGILSENLVLLTIGGLLFATFLLLGGNHLLARRFDNPDLVYPLLVIAPYGLFMIMTKSLTACLMSADRYRQVAAYNFGSRLFMLVMVVGIVCIWPTPMYAVTGHLLGAALMLVIAMVLMFRACPNGSIRPTRAGIWEQLKYATPLGFTRVFGVIRFQLDKLLIAIFFSPERYAIYDAGAVEIPFIGGVTQSITQVLFPDLTALYRDGKLKEALSIWQRAATKAALAIFPATVFFIAMAPETMQLLFSTEYAESTRPFRIYTLLLPAKVANYGVMFLSAGRSKLLMWVHMFGLVFNLIVSLILLKTLGFLGPAWAAVLTTYAWYALVFILLIAKLYKINAATVLPLRQLGIAAIVSLIPAVVFFLKMRIAIPKDLAIPTPFSWSIPISQNLISIAIFGTLYVCGVVFCYDRFGLVKMSSLVQKMRGHFFKR